VPSAGSSTASISLAAISITVDPSTPTSAGASSSVNFRFNITDFGDVVQGLYAHLEIGSTPFNVSSAAWVATVQLTSLGSGNYFVNLPANMPSTGSVLYYALAMYVQANANSDYVALYSPDPAVAPFVPWQIAIVNSTGVNVTVSKVPFNAARVVVMADGGAVNGVVYGQQIISPPGASSTTISLGLPPGTYRIRALADTGSNGQLLRSGQTMTTVPSAGSSTASISLAAISITVDPSTPTSAGASSPVNFRFNITDFGDVVQGLYAHLEIGSTPFNVSSAAWVATVQLTSLGSGTYYVNLPANMPSTGSALHYALAMYVQANANSDYVALYSPDPTTSVNPSWQIAIGASCSYTFSQTSITIPAGASNGALGITTGATCPWNPQTTASWLSLASPSLNTGTGSLQFTATQNTGAASRTATLLVAGQSITITQQGASSTTGPIDLPNVAVYRPTAGLGTFVLDLDQTTYNYSTATSKSRFFGLPGDQPVAGDWDGTGVVRIGVYRAGAWYLDLNNNGAFDLNEGPFFFGLPGDIAVVGDWSGTGITNFGVFRCPPVGTGLCQWQLSTAVTQANARSLLVPSSVVYSASTTLVYSYGLPGDKPVVSNWAGTPGADRIGVFRCPAAGVCAWIVDSPGLGVYNSADAQYSFGVTGDLPVVGDWNGTGRKRIGVFRGGLWILDSIGSNTFDPSEIQARFGLPGDLPVVGKWTMP
jgi:hypothetical protein